jgi:curli biogenesis system outer membrane secretion channel CsgG
MKQNLYRQFVVGSLCLTLAIPGMGQTPAAAPKPAAAPAKPAVPPAPAKPAAVPAAPAKPAAAPAVAPKKPAAADLTVDKLVQMVKMKMPEATILQAVRANKKTLKPTVDDLMKLKEAGASDAIINELSGAGGGDAAPAAAAVAGGAAKAAAPASAPAVAAYNTDLSTIACEAVPEARKRVVAVEEFDYAAVKNVSQAVFGTNVDVGKGMRALIIKRLSEQGKYRVVERAKVNKVIGEQDFGASNRVKQGTQARVGRILGADIILAGDITVFGRDDKKKGFSTGGLGPSVLAGVKIGSREDKAVVAVNIRLIDVESTEILQASEARGESLRKSKNFAVAGFGPGGGGGLATDMTSSNFAETIIGEATIKAIDGVSEFLNTNENKIPIRNLDAEGRIATVEGNRIFLSIGSNDFVKKCDRFEIHKVIKEVTDPVTKEVLDMVTEQVGQLLITEVKDRVSIGFYNGSSAPQIGQLARKAQAPAKK